MTPVEERLVPVICVVVLAAFAWLALRTLMVTSWRTPPGRPPPPADTASHPMRERGRRGL